MATIISATLEIIKFVQANFLLQPGFEARSMLRCLFDDASMQGAERKKVRDDPFKRICTAFVTNLYQKRNGSGINFFKVQHSYTLFENP